MNIGIWCVAFCAALPLKAADIEIKSVHGFLDAGHSRVYRGDDDSAAQADETEAKQRFVRVWVYIKNPTAHEIKVPTKGMKEGINSDARSVTFRLVAAFPNGNPLGIKIVIPEAEFAPVTLKPGEVTMIEWGDWSPEEKLQTVRVLYQVDDDVAQRYNFWSGKVEVVSEHLGPPKMDVPKVKRPRPPN